MPDLSLTAQYTGIDTLELSDRDLLRRFVQDADEEAFAAIVRRYHGLVMSVCRRVTCRTLDAEDAFQATFLALARRPPSIRRATSLSSWLYVVAWRTSVRLVRKRRKQPMERLSAEPANTTPGPLDQIASAQNLLVLDEELNQLPAKYRDVLVMAYFANRSNQQIADELNISRGAVDGRLRRGRNQLRIRLARRGVALGVLAVVAGLPGQAAAATSAELLATTTQLGIQTLNCDVPAATDLSALEPLVRPEMAVMNTSLLITTVVCVSVLAGALGLAVPLQDDHGSGQGLVLQEHVMPSTAETLNAAQFVLVAQSESANSSSPETDANDVETTEGVYGSLTFGSLGTRFNTWSEDARPVERWMHEMLDERVPKLEFKGEVRLSEILDFLSQHFTEQHGEQGQESFRMAIWPDYPVLELENIDSLDDVVLKDIRIDGMTLRNALKAIFGMTTDPSLTYVIRDELLVVTTVNEAQSEDSLTTRVYPVSRLLAVDTPDWGELPKREASEFPSGSGQGYFQLSDEVQDPDQAVEESSGEEQNIDVRADPRGVNMQRLVFLVQQMTSPPLEWQQNDGQGGSIDSFGESLVIRQTYDGHQRIVRLLNQLTDSVD